MPEMEPPPSPLSCQVCQQPAESGYAAPLCPSCRTNLANRPFPIWIKIAAFAVGLVFLYALARSPRSLSAAVAFERGQRAEAGGNFATAASEYSKVAEAFPTSTLAVARTGIAEYQAGHRDAAIRTLNSIVGRHTSKELTAEVNGVLVEARSGSRSNRYSSPTAQSAATPSSSDSLDHWIADNFPSASPSTARTQSTAKPNRSGMVTADLGEAEINIPSPPGFFRIDGKSERVDAQLKVGLASTNRLLGAFGSDADLAVTMKDEVPELRRWLFAQTLVKSDHFADARWSRLKSSLRSNLEADMQKLNSSELWAKIQSNVASTSKNLGLEYSGAKVVPLEVFDEDKNSLCYGVLLKSQFRAADSAEPMTVIQYESAAVVYVRQRVLYLYACAAFEGKEDAEWARTSLRRWRDAVVAANQ